MSERKMVIDFESEIVTHLAAIKRSGTMRPDANAIAGLSKIFEELTGDKSCLTCSGHLAKVYKYFLSKAKNF